MKKLLFIFLFTGWVLSANARGGGHHHRSSHGHAHHHRGYLTTRDEQKPQHK